MVKVFLLVFVILILYMELIEATNTKRSKSHHTSKSSHHINRSHHKIPANHHNSKPNHHVKKPHKNKSHQLNAPFGLKIDRKRKRLEGDECCRDIATNCQYFTTVCFDWAWKHILVKFCPLTCGLCKPCESDCRDTSNNCSNLKGSGFCARSFANVQMKLTMCAKTCGMCKKDPKSNSPDSNRNDSENKNQDKNNDGKSSDNGDGNGKSLGGNKSHNNSGDQKTNTGKKDGGKLDDTKTNTGKKDGETSGNGEKSNGGKTNTGKNDEGKSDTNSGKTRNGKSGNDKTNTGKKDGGKPDDNKTDTEKSNENKKDDGKPDDSKNSKLDIGKPDDTGKPVDTQPINKNPGVEMTMFTGGGGCYGTSKNYPCDGTCYPLTRNYKVRGYGTGSVSFYSDSNCKKSLGDFKFKGSEQCRGNEINRRTIVSIKCT